MKKKIAILIDSACTYSPSFLKENEDVYVVPLSITDSNNHVYEDDNISIGRSVLLERLDAKEVFKTSATPIGKLMTKVEDLLEQYENVIFLPIAIGLSSQYSQSMIIKNEHPNNFFIVKSLTAAGGNEFLLKHLINLIKTNNDPQTIVNEVEQMNQFIASYFSCEELSGMKTSGRVSKFVLKAVNALGLKPIIELHEKNHYAGIGKSYPSITMKIIKNINKDFNTTLTSGFIKNIIVYFSDYAKTKLDFLIETFSRGFGFPREQIQVRDIPNVVLVHTHRGAYGLSIECSLAKKNKKYKD